MLASQPGPERGDLALADRIDVTISTALPDSPGIRIGPRMANEPNFRTL